MANVLLEWLVYYLIAINFVAFAAFGLDKSFAENGGRRISESRLLGWAMMGGTPGAYAGRHLFRHKTRKVSFSERLHAVAMFQVLMLAVGFAYFRFG